MISSSTNYSKMSLSSGRCMLLGLLALSCGGPDDFHLLPSVLHFRNSFTAVFIIHGSELMKGEETNVLSVC